MTSWLRHFPRDLVIALVVGVISLAVSFFVGWTPSAGTRGFPFSVTYVIPGCFGPGYPLGCLAYDLVGVVLDCIFWAGLALVIVVYVDWAATRGASA
jgi:hypothetical protein